MEEEEKEITKIRWLIGFNYFNLMDALLTMYVIQDHGFHEVNPIMKYILDINPSLFFMLKISLGALCTLYFMRKREIGYKMVKTLTFILAGIVGLNSSLLLLRLLEWI